MPNGKTEIVKFQLPDGSIQPFEIPSGLSDSEARTFVLSKRPDLFQSVPPGGQPPNAVAQAKTSFQNTPQYTSGADQLRAEFAAAQKSPQYNEYMRQSGSLVGQTAGGMIGGSLASGLVTKGLPKFVGTIGKASVIGAGVGTGQLVAEPEQPMKALSTAAGTTAGAMILSPVAKFIQNLAGKAKAGPLFQAVSEGAGENTLDTTGAQAAAQRSDELAKAGMRKPEVISRFLARMKTGKPLTFDEGRDFEQAAGGRLAPAEASRLKPQQFRQLSIFASEMRKATMQAAGQSGQAETFSDALQMHRAGALAQEKMEFAKEAMMNLIKMAGKGAAYTAGAGGAYEAGKAIFGGGKK